MTIPLPRSRLRAFLTRKSSYEWPIQLLGTVGLIFLALREEIAGNRAGAIVAVAATVGIVFLATIRWWIARSEEKLRTSHDALLGVLETLRYAMVASGPFSDDPGLRLCVYVPVPNKRKKRRDPAKYLCRVTPYVGDLEPGEAGSHIEASKGIVGLCLRDDRVPIQIAKLPANTVLGDFLVNSFGYDRSEVAAMRADAKAWAAVQVRHSRTGKLIGVIFANTKHRDFFGKANGPRRAVLEGAAVALAGFAERYYN